MNSKRDNYHRFQQEGWQRTAAAYDSAWKELTRPFARHLIHGLGNIEGIHLLDVACGPGYAAEAAFALGAIPAGGLPFRIPPKLSIVLFKRKIYGKIRHPFRL